MTWKILSTTPHPYWFYIGCSDTNSVSSTNQTLEEATRKIVSWCSANLQGDFAISSDNMKMRVYSALKDSDPGFGIAPGIRKETTTERGLFLSFREETDAAAFKLQFGGDSNQ